MIIGHNLKDCKKEGVGEASFLLANKLGGFALFGIDSRYNGVFFSLGSGLLKVIEDVRIKGKTTKIINNFSSVDRVTGGVIERFRMHANSLIYELSESAPVDIRLDVRAPYDNREWGRQYNVTFDKNRIIIHFTKSFDSRDHDAKEGEEYSIYLVITSDERIRFGRKGEWIRRVYTFDQERNSLPFERYVYDAVKLVAKKLVFSVALDKGEAPKEAARAIKSRINKAVVLSGCCRRLNDKEVALAFQCAVNSLNSLVLADSHAIYAGLPWFFQVWSRDEAISLKAALLQNEFGLVKSILLRQLQSIGQDGCLPSRFPSIGIASADAIGWHFRRWHELIDALLARNLLYQHFDKKQLIEITFQLKRALDAFRTHHTKDEFVINLAQETWMDTLGREGCRIELQALMLNMYRLAYRLSGDPADQRRELSLRQQVRERFWNGSYLVDGIGDETIRPNLFIAAYLYPDLLTNQEWESCFERVLPSLWLPWGGLSTIDTASPLFCSSNTGEGPRSYHNGDSWFWLNNLTAIVLHRINKERFANYFNAILKASTREILWSGAIGHHAELSSANALKSQGCLSQAWSSAMYIELVHALYALN